MAQATKVERQADVVWQGDLQTGSGRLRTGSGALGELEVTFASRTGAPEGKTSPEELIAAAHASCFAMALSNGLSKQGHAPQRLEISATCSLAGLTITEVDLRVRGKVPGIDKSGFESAAEAAKSNCPVSKALAGSVEIELEAELEE